jgi:hypothetical protein
MASQSVQESFVLPMPTKHGFAILVASIDNMARLELLVLPPTVDIGPLLLPVETLELASPLGSPSLQTSETIKQLQ